MNVLDTHLCLESAEQVAEVRMFGAERQDFALDHSALDIVVLQHYIFL